jgi:tetratricopeptide (TPR) repeat protein
VVEPLDPAAIEADLDEMPTREVSVTLTLDESELEILPSEADVADADMVQRTQTLRDSYLAEAKKLPAADRTRQAQLLFEVARIEEENLDDPEAAFNHYRESFTKDGSLAVNLRALRRMQLERNDVTSAIKTLDAEVRICANQEQRATLLYERGLMQLGLGEQKAAERSLKRSLEIDATFLPALAAMGHIAESQGDTRAAAKLLVRMAQICEDDHRKGLIMSEVGVLAECDDQHAEALDRYRIAIGYDPQLVGARFALERLYTVRGDWGALTDMLLQTADRSSDKDIVAAYRFLAGSIAGHRLGEDLRAALLHEQCFETRPERELPLEELKDIYERQGSVKELIHTLVRQLARAEGRLSAVEAASTLFQVGELYERLDDPDQGIARYREALERSSAFVPAKRALMRALTAAGKHGDVAELLRAEADATADPERRTDVLAHLAELTEWQLKSPEDAIPIYQESLRQRPGGGVATRALDRLYTERGEWTALTELLQAGADGCEDPGRRTALLKRMAWIQEVHLDQPDNATHTLERLLEEPASQRDVAMALSRVYQAQQRFEDLVKNLEREAELSQDGPEILALLCYAGEIAEAQLNDTGRARQLYMKVLEKAPTSIRALRNLGRLYLAAGYWDELVETYKKELVAIPKGYDSAVLSFRIGQLLETRIGDDSAAERAFNDALDQAPDYTPALEGLAALLTRRGRWKDLVEILVSRSAKLETPDRRADGLLRAAQLTFHRMGNVDQALKLCQEAIEIDDSLLEAHLLWEQLSASNGRFDELTSVLTTSLADDDLPRSARVRLGLKLTMIRRVHLGSPSGAMDAARHVLLIEPRNAEALFVLASMLRRERLVDELPDVLGRLADTTADPVTATADLIHLGVVLPPDQQYDAVRADIYDRVLTINPTHPFALCQQERLARRHEDVATLADLMRRRAEDSSDPNTQIAAFMTLGDLAWRAGELDSAAGWFSRASQINPQWLPCVRSLRSLREAQGRSAEVAELLEQEAKLAVDQDAVVKALMEAASIWLQAYADTERAEKLYGRVFDLEPGNPVAFQRLAALLDGRDAHEELAPIYRKRINVADKAEKIQLLLQLATLWEQQLERHQDAAETLEEALRLDRENGEALIHISRIYRQLERWRAAVVSLDRLVKVSSEPEIVRQANYVRAELLELELGEDDKALESIQAVLASHPSDRDALTAAARLHERLGQWEGAVNALASLAEHAPPGERASTLLHMASIYEQGLGRTEQANEHVARAAALCSLAPEAVTALGEHFAKREDFEGYDHLLARVLKGAPLRSAGMVALHLARAANMSERLKRHDDAEKEIRLALTDEPNSVDCLLALGELHLARENPALAQVEYHGVLERDPFQPAAYRGLLRVFDANHEKDRARLAAQVLVALDQARDDELKLAQEVHAPNQLQVPPQPLTLEGYQQLMATREDRPTARMLLGLLTPHLHLVFTPDFTRWGLGEDDDLPASHPLRARAVHVAAILGLEDEFKIAISKSKPDAMAIEHAEEPTIIVGRKLAKEPERELDFLLGRALGRILAKTVYLGMVNLRDLEVTIAGVVAQYDKSYGLHLGDEEDLPGVGRAFMRKLSRKQAPTTRRRSPGCASSTSARGTPRSASG